MDKSGYQLSHREDIKFHWKGLDLHMDVVFHRGIEIPFSASNFNGFGMTSLAEDPTLTDKEQDKPNPPPAHPTTPVSERSTNPLVLMGGLPLRQEHSQKSKDCCNLTVGMQ